MPRLLSREWGYLETTRYLPLVMGACWKPSHQSWVQSWADYLT